AEAELAVGFFGSRYERATPAEREYMRAMAALSAADVADDMDLAVPTAEIARSLDRKPASLSPARDALIKKGLIYSGERGTVAFTVPHFGRYLRAQPLDA
ncbi:MAG: ATP-binding protein, partial [Micromonosporaceae bacterium]